MQNGGFILIVRPKEWSCHEGQRFDELSHCHRAPRGHGAGCHKGDGRAEEGQRSGGKRAPPQGVSGNRHHQPDLPGGVCQGAGPGQGQGL